MGYTTTPKLAPITSRLTPHLAGRTGDTRETPNFPLSNDKTLLQSSEQQIPAA